MREYVVYDFKRYVEYAAGLDHYEVCPFQYLIADFMQGAKPEWIWRKKVILGFRGSAKTWLCVRRYIEWRLLRVPSTQIIVHSSTDRLAAGITGALLETFRHNPLFNHLKPRGQPGSTAFNLQGIRVEKGDQITSVGIKTAMTGTRGHLYIFDDPEPDNSPEAMHAWIMAAYQEAELILHPVDKLWPSGVVPDPEKTQFIVVGQPHWTGTAYLPPPPDPMSGDEDSHPLSDAKFLKIPPLMVCDKDHPDAAWSKKFSRYERSLMPGRFPSAEQIHKRDDKIIEPPRWRLQMEIDTTPVEGVGSVIKVTKLPKLHRDIWAGAKKTMVVDPADSAERCEWGVVIAGLWDNMIHVIDMVGFRSEVWDVEGEKMPGEEAWESIFELAESVGVHDIYLEKNYKAAAISAKRTLRKLKMRANVYEYAATQNKLARITRSLDLPLNSGMVSFEPHVIEDPRNFRQLSELRYTKLPVPDDRIDALAAVIDHLLDMPNVTGITSNAKRVHHGFGSCRPGSYDSLPTARRSPFDSLRSV